MRLAAAALGVSLLLAGCGNAPRAPSGVAWDGKPIVVLQPELPRDTIVSGTISNKGNEPLKLDATDVRVLSDGGEALQSTARFSTGVTHQLYPPREGPREKDPTFLRERLGEVATVAPGKSVPLVVSWRLRPGQAPPVRVDLGRAWLALPAGG